VVLRRDGAIAWIERVGSEIIVRRRRRMKTAVLDPIRSDRLL
jgi:hypothetical protein